MLSQVSPLLILLLTLLPAGLTLLVVLNLLMLSLVVLMSSLVLLMSPLVVLMLSLAQVPVVQMLSLVLLMSLLVVLMSSLVVLMSSLMLPVVPTPHPCTCPTPSLRHQARHSPFKNFTSTNEAGRGIIVLTEVGLQSLFAVMKASSPSKKMGVSKHGLSSERRKGI
jgi:hypothetical protein